LFAGGRGFPALACFLSLREDAMSEIIIASNAIITRPIPQVNVTLRAGVLSDLPFLMASAGVEIDAL